MTDLPDLPDLPENWQNLKPPAPQPAPPAPEPEPKRRARKPRTAAAPVDGEQPLPKYLDPLIRLGVDRGDFTECGADLRTCWIEVESSEGHRKAAPLAHLAPDAIDTLYAWGFDGHTTFALLDGRDGAPLAYFAAILPEQEGGEEDPAAAPDTQLARIERLLMHQIQHQAAPAGDPLGVLRQALPMFKEIAGMFQMPAPPAAPEPRGGGLSDVIDTVATIGRILNSRGGDEPPAPEPVPME